MIKKQLGFLKVSMNIYFNLEIRKSPPDAPKI